MRYVRIFLVSYQIDGEWQGDGEWFNTKRHAHDQARANRDTFGWPSKVVPLDVPLDAILPKARSRLRRGQAGERGRGC